MHNMIPTPCNLLGHLIPILTPSTLYFLSTSFFLSLSSLLLYVLFFFSNWCAFFFFPSYLSQLSPRFFFACQEQLTT
ncbi:hypothetical protein F5H01DRAFT_358774 [Linnemannia elongata]|nr:hypothetical protein F5H01DRAFT_358774 [Linnemannia elongata]